MDSENSWNLKIPEIFNPLMILQTKTENETYKCHKDIPWATGYDNTCFHTKNCTTNNYDMAISHFDLLFLLGAIIDDDMSMWHIT